MSPIREIDRRVLKAVAALALPALASACFATRSDVRTLQQDVALVRAEAARADSLRGRETRQEIERLIASIRPLNDSIAAVSARLTRFRGEVQGRFSTFEEEVQRVQELAGQSQTRLQEMRAALERTAAPASGAGAPGPAQLYQIGHDQLLRGSNAAARTAFQDLLTRFPAADSAGDAQFYIAETYAAEGNTAAADSAYGIVVRTYRRSPRAGTALYKRAVIAEGGRRTAEARRLYNEVITRFPRSDEAALARDRLTTLR